MADKKIARKNHESKLLVITREFDAPRDLVWKYWTDPELVLTWWGPEHFTAPYAKSDFRVGGKYLYCMRGPDGKDYWSTGTFKEIVPNERIVATDSFADKDGNVVSASYYGLSADYPMELMLTMTFESVGRKTRVSLRHAGHPPGNDVNMARQGWNESLDKLAQALNG